MARIRIDRETAFSSGKILDGTKLGVPEFWLIRSIRDQKDAVRAIAHASLERAETDADVRRIDGFIRRLASYVGRTGGYVMVGFVTYHHADRGIRVTIDIHDGRHTHRDIVLSQTYPSVGVHEKNGTHCLPARVDALMRELSRRRLARVASTDQARAKWEADYLSTLPDHVRTLQMTARCSCIQVTVDGLSVVEHLHDVGGTMTNTVGRNGYVLPDSLADLQARHDAIYHASERVS